MSTKKSDSVKARRDMNHIAVLQWVESMDKAMTRVEISKGVDALLGRQGDGVSWNDTGTSIATLVKAGTLQETKVGEKKRTFYTKVAPKE